MRERMSRDDDVRKQHDIVRYRTVVSTVFQYSSGAIPKFEIDINIKHKT